jgi:hypothetical protein
MKPKPEVNEWLRDLWAKLAAGDGEAFILLTAIIREPHRAKELVKKFKATGRV